MNKNTENASGFPSVVDFSDEMIVVCRGCGRPHSRGRFMITFYDEKTPIAILGKTPTCSCGVASGARPIAFKTFSSANKRMSLLLKEKQVEGVVWAVFYREIHSYTGRN